MTWTVIKRHGEKMTIYDYLIVGGGIAGSVCARELGKGERNVLSWKKTAVSRKRYAEAECHIRRWECLKKQE